ncbi:MAG: ABC transporter ATP-binding protein [Planctomycetes bacterium]|nr:ABC transporter ATP-binding protein [Planctomycetota bacterium]
MLPASTPTAPLDPVSSEGGPGRVVVRGLAKRFGAKVALRPTDLDLGPGGIVGLLGPNGSGKSTLLRALTGLVPRDAGRASVDGVELVGDGTAVRRRVSYAPGELALYGEKSGREHLAWLVAGRDPGAEERALAIAEGLGLPLGKRVRTYSHGMKRQLLLSAALAPDVRVRILDEPTEGLDPTKRGEVLALLREDAARGRTLLLSSHHLGEVDRVCDHLVFLNAGAKIADERAAGVQARARRLVRFAYGAGEDLDALLELARAHGARSARVRDARLVVELESDDPRAFLAKALADPAWPKPLAIEYGQLSLAELYRDLYGVEGC